MTEFHPSISAVGTHFDEEVETAPHAPHDRIETERTLKTRSTDYQMRDGKASTVSEQSKFLPDDPERQIEEMMHLDQ